LWLNDSMTNLPPIPPDYPVQPFTGDTSLDAIATCGSCGRSWDDSVVTSMTPSPSARCPFEPFHAEPVTNSTHRRGLTILNDSPRKGVYIGGYNIAPDCLLITADSYESAWEIMCEHFAEQGSLAECEHTSEEDAESCDSHDWVDGFGYMVTLDLVLQVVRPVWSD
jgi:hypothetical protein